MAMTLEEVLAQNDPSLVRSLGEKELARLFWKYKGLEKRLERDSAFWSSPNDNLKVAYEKLDEQERELNRAYSMIREDLGVAQQVQTALLPRLSGAMKNEIELGVFELTRGQNRITAEVVGSNEQAVKAYMFGLDYIRLEPGP